MTKVMFSGCGTALVTPFHQNGALDEATLRRLVARQIDAGIDFLCPCGTTGESPTLEREEHVRVVEVTVNEARGRVPVLAGAGGYNTREVCDLITAVENVGADGILSVTPYYNKPTQDGLFAHYRTLAGSTRLPIVVYSVQPRTSVNIEVATVMRLSSIPNIVAIKEASGSIGQIASIAARIPDSFSLLSGDDALTIPVIALGGRGVISVAANQIPGPFADLTHLAIRGDFEGARRLQRQYQELIELNFIETSPGPLKYAMGRMGLLDPVYRLPLVAPCPESRLRLDQVLDSLGLSVHAVASGVPH